MLLLVLMLMLALVLRERDISASIGMINEDFVLFGDVVGMAQHVSMEVHTVVGIVYGGGHYKQLFFLMGRVGETKN